MDRVKVYRTELTVAKPENMITEIKLTFAIQAGHLFCSVNAAFERVLFIFIKEMIWKSNYAQTLELI